MVSLGLLLTSQSFEWRSNTQVGRQTRLRSTKTAMCLGEASEFAKLLEFLILAVGLNVVQHDFFKVKAFEVCCVDKVLIIRVTCVNISGDYRPSFHIIQIITGGKNVRDIPWFEYRNALQSVLSLACILRQFVAFAGVASRNL